jgi:MHS family alpha-ketoglutarate permease-like MFS transporter
MSAVADSISAVGASGATDRSRRIVAIIGASSGNLVEWYDFYAYAFTSIYFASAFFPSGDATSQLLATAGIFAVGFFMRPLGGWPFGWIADKHGRRTSMIISVGGAAPLNANIICAQGRSIICQYRNHPHGNLVVFYAG